MYIYLVTNFIIERVRVEKYLVVKFFFQIILINEMSKQYLLHFELTFLLLFFLKIKNVNTINVQNITLC